MITLARLASVLQTLFTATALEVAARLGLVKRRRRFAADAFAQGLTFGWLQAPDATLSQLSACLALAGCSMSTPALCQHFNDASAAFLLELLQSAAGLLVSTQSAAVPLLSRFSAVHLLDATTLSLPPALVGRWRGSRGTSGDVAGMKVMASWELLGGLLQLTFHPGRDSDCTSELAQQALPKGALRLADLGFFDIPTLARYDEDGVYWVSRVQPNTVVFDGTGRRAQLWAYLACMPQRPLDLWVELGGSDRLACRLVACPCPPHVAAKRREQARRRAEKNRHNLNEERLALCDWTVFVTNVPAAKLSWREVWVVYRVRWQVERLFKLWKSLGGLERTRGEKAARMECEVYAKLLGVLVRHWLLLSRGGWWLGRCLWKEAAVTRLLALLVLLGLSEADKLEWLLGKIGQALKVLGGVEKRRKKPATFQTLKDPENDGMEVPQGCAPLTTPPELPPQTR